MRRQGWTLQRMADRFRVSRPAIHHCLTRRPSRTNQARVLKPCACGCGRVTVRRFATRRCYSRARLQNPRYVGWRHGQRLARRVVQTVFPLPPGAVVHHVDGNSRHNALTNLWVFASHADHMSFHRGGLGRPIWRGDGGRCGEAGAHRVFKK